jgi:transposase-like protein
MVRRVLMDNPDVSTSDLARQAGCSETLVRDARRKLSGGKKKPARDAEE